MITATPEYTQITKDMLRRRNFLGSFDLYVDAREGFTTLRPIDAATKKQIADAFDIPPEEDGFIKLPIIFPSRALNFPVGITADDDGCQARYYLRRSKSGRTITAVPDPNAIARLASKGYWNTTKVPAPKLQFEKEEGRGWKTKHPVSGIIILPIKGWNPQPLEGNANLSVVYEAGKLLVQPTLTATFLVAGPLEVMSKVAISALMPADEDYVNEHRFDRATEYPIFRTLLSAYEIVRVPVFNGPIDLNAFRFEVTEAVNEAKKWFRAALVRFAHPDLTRAAIIDALSGSNLNEVEGLMDDLVGRLEPGISKMLTETRQNFDAAVNEFLDWAKWAEKEIVRRRRLNLPMAVPQPQSGRKMRTVPLVEWNTEGVTNRVKQLILAEHRKQTRKPVATVTVRPTAQVMAIATVDEYRIALARKAKPGNLADAIRQHTATPSSTSNGNGSHGHHERITHPESTAHVSGTILAGMEALKAKREELAEIRVYCPKCHTVMEDVPVRFIQTDEINCDCGWHAPAHTTNWKIMNYHEQLGLSAKQFVYISHETGLHLSYLAELATLDENALMKTRIITRKQAYAIVVATHKLIEELYANSAVEKPAEPAEKATDNPEDDFVYRLLNETAEKPAEPAEEPKELLATAAV